jgi:hypothetical protein
MEHTSHSYHTRLGSPLAPVLAQGQPLAPALAPPHEGTWYKCHIFRTSRCHGHQLLSLLCGYGRLTRERICHNCHIRQG